MRSRHSVFMRIINSMVFEVKLPMKLDISQKGAKDIIHNWSYGGRLIHVEVKQLFLRESKEAGIIEFYWKRGEDMTTDVFTKNLARTQFEKHIKVFFGEDRYISSGLVQDPYEKN